MILDIGDISIKIIVGKGKNIVLYETINTPEGSVSNNTIEDIDAVVKVISDFRDRKSLKADDLIFVTKGQDVILRHTDVPMMDYRQIQDSAVWEISQNLPDEGESHYIDFEIVEKINNKDEKINKLIVAAAPREKIDKYVEIAERLHMKIKAVDTSANCIARVFSNIQSKDKVSENIAVIQIGEKDSRIVILDGGNLFIERELIFGTSNLTKPLIAKNGMTESDAINYIKENINLTDINEEDENEVRIKRLFDNVLSSFQKVIQFYGTGRVKRNLDKIYVTGAGAEIKDLSTYVNNFLDVETVVFDSSKEIPFTFPEGFKVNLYIAAFGALLRSNSYTELNLLPYRLKNRGIKLTDNKRIMTIVSIVIGVLILVAVIPKLYLIKLNNDNTVLKEQITANNHFQIENDKLNKQKNDYTKQIDTADKMQKTKAYPSKWVQAIIDQLPSDVSTDSISKDKGKDVINLSGETMNSNSISTFSNKLQNSGNFTDVKILNINQDQNSSYKFTLTLREVVK